MTSFLPMETIRRILEKFRKKQVNQAHRDFLRVLRGCGFEITPKSGSIRIVRYRGEYAFTYHEPHGKAPMNPWDVEKLLDFIDDAGIEEGGYEKE